MSVNVCVCALYWQGCVFMSEYVCTHLQGQSEPDTSENI